MRAQTLNLILEKTDQVRYYTNMNLVFDALSIDPASYDWYVSDIETNYYGSNFPSEDRWISGSALKEFLAENDVQFIWAVFSAFPIGVRVEVIDPPYIEDNPRYWNGEEISPQLSGAIFEIACWDSSATILVGVPIEAATSFVSKFKDTKPLVGARG